MRVLVVNHAGVVGGAEHSLLTLLGGLPTDVDAVLAAPPGPLHQRARALGVRTFAIPGTSGSFRLDAIRTPLAVAGIARSAGAVRRLASRLGSDLVHANTVRSGLIAGLATRIGGPPVVTHVRDVLPPGWTSNAVKRTVCDWATNTICISERVKAAFADGDEHAVVVPNGVDLGCFDPVSHDRAAIRSSLGIGDEEPVLAVIAQLTPWKGQDDAIAAVGLLSDAWPQCRLLLVGEAKFAGPDARHDNDAYARGLRQQVAQLDLGDRVSFLGERLDVSAILAALDVLLVPSWEEPFGRTVIEGMAMERAVVATVEGGPAEIIEQDRTGMLLAPRNPTAWAEAIDALLADDSRRAEMGRAARAALRGRFDRATHVAAVVAVYRAVLAR